MDESKFAHVIPKIVISKTSMATTSSSSEEDSATSTPTRSWADLSALERRRHFRRSRSVADMRSTDGYTPAEIRLIRDRLARSFPNPRPSVIRSFTRRQRMTLASLALVDFTSFCSMSIMAPFFPQEAAAKGLSNVTSGFVFSFYSLIMFVSSPIFGKILPKVGAKFLFMWGIFIAGACNILFGFLEYIHDRTTFTAYCFLIRGLEALGASAYSTSSYVFVVDMFPSSIGSVLGVLETFVGLGMCLGPAIGGFLYSLGGFGTPFYVLGISMILIIPINHCLLPPADDYDRSAKSGSLIKLLKIPSVLVIGLVVVVVSNIWGFLDPTLEPHLRQFDLTPQHVGLIFLLFSALYGLSSPLWGCLADRVHNHWSMMTVGLMFCTAGLLLLGPSTLVPLECTLPLQFIALSILGVAIALTLLPTFQSILTSAVTGGCGDSLTTCSIVAGLWSCMYALGEVFGPALGGIFFEHFGFPIATTIMAALTFSLAIITLIFFIVRDNCTPHDEYSSDSGISGSWKTSGDEDDEFINEKEPLLKTTCPDIGYTTEKPVDAHGNTRRHKNERVCNEKDRTSIDVKGMIAVTARGACEV